MLPGEATHKAGDDGARRARRYLESTTRVKTVWLNTESHQAGRMTFPWPHDPEPFSFDLGGIFHEGPINGHHFAGESKAYRNNNNHQPTEYKRFLAGCYVVDRDHSGLYQHYLWITQHPFNVQDWAQLCTPEWVVLGLLQERQRVFGVDSEDEARASIDSELVAAVARKLWLFVIPDRHEELCISDKDRSIVFAKAVEEGRL